MLNTFWSRTNCEEDAKFIQGRIVNFERTITELTHIFAQYSRKAARLRDKNDELSKILTSYTESEQINQSLSENLGYFSESLEVLGGYGDLRTQNLDDKVVKELMKYEEHCRRAKEEVRSIYNAREKEIARKRQLDRVRERNPRNRQQIIQAETEVIKATTEVNKTIENLEEKTTEFERQKLHDLKAILLDFVTVEMGYHAKSLEVLTRAYKALDTIDENSDLEDFNKVRDKMEADFKKSLRYSATPRTSLFRTTNSLGSLGALFSHNPRPQGIPKGPKAKSEEILDSVKKDVSSTEDSLTENSGSEVSLSEDVSPVRKSKK